MRAVVLVGGFGTRLRPLTNTIPKPMLPVGHVPIIERHVANLVRGGVTDVTLALGFKPEPFLAAFPDGNCAGARLSYAVDPEPLDTAGAIGYAARQVGIDETFVVPNGDVLTDLDVAALVGFHRARGAEATLHLTPVADPSAFGVVECDEHGRVQRFVEKPAPGETTSNLINAGTYVLEPSVIARIPEGRKVSIEREVFPAIVSSGTLWATATDDYWIDTGVPDLYLQANLDIVNGRRHSLGEVEAVAASARVGVDVEITDVVVAHGAEIADGAFVSHSVLLEGASIGAGATVSHSVIMGRVGAGAQVQHCIVGADGVVPDGESRSGERIPLPIS